MAGVWCLGGCKTLVHPEYLICTACRGDLEKYGAENPAMVDRIRAWSRDNPVADLERLLKNHAAFERWEAARPINPDKEGKT